MSLEREIKLKSVFSFELEKYVVVRQSSEKWQHLERLHILGQSYVLLHLKTHWLMLNLAIEEAKFSEILGQLFRLALVIPGHILNRLPLGNVGTTRVSAFQRMDIPKDLQDLL